MTVSKCSDAWENARSAHLTAVKEMERIIPGYGYGDGPQAQITDEKLCAHLVQALRKAKSRLFDIISFIFESHVEKVLDTEFHKLRDEIDVLSDEIKVHKLKWQPLNRDFLEIIIKHDMSLIHGVAKLNNMLNNITTLITGYRRINHKVFDTERITKVLGQVKEQVKVLVRTYKEREAVFNIQKEDLEDAYERIRKEVEQKF